MDGISSSMEVEVRDLSKELEELLKTTLSPKTKEVSSQYFTASQILEFCRLHHDFIGNSKYANIFPMKNNYFAIVYENQVDGKPFVYIREGGKGRFWDAEHIPRIFLLN